MKEQEYIKIIISAHKFHSPCFQGWLDTYNEDCWISHNNFGEVAVEFCGEYNDDAPQALKRIAKCDDLTLRAVYA